MEVGDKLYCHTEYYHAYNDVNFSAGKWYKIFTVEELSNLDYNDDGELEWTAPETHVRVIGDFERTKFRKNYIKKYFYTEKEYRKLKLDKINERKR